MLYFLFYLFIHVFVAYVFREKLYKNFKIFVWSLKVPGPTSLPIVGSGHRFMCSKDEILNKIRGIFRECPYPLFKVWLGPKLIVMIREPKYLEKIMQSTMNEKDELMHVAKPFLGDGLLTGSGPKWKSHKKIIAPLFGTKSVENYHSIFCTQAAIMVEKMKMAVENKQNVITLEDYLHPCAIDIVCDSIMDTKLNAQESLNHEFMEAIYAMYDLLIERMVKPWLYPDILYSFSKQYVHSKKTNRILRKFITETMEERSNQNRAYVVKQVVKNKIKHSGDPMNNTVEPDSDEEMQLEGERKSSILDKLMEAKMNGTLHISHEEIIDELLTIFMASSDTIAAITGACLKMLSMYPKYQEKVIEEITEVSSRLGDDINNSFLSELTFLEMCIKETIRLFPIGPFIVRINNKDFKLDENTYIPKGASVMMALFEVHRDPKYWSDPEGFNPDHFLPEIAAKRHPYAYLPFSSGARSCIGKLYANISVKILVVKVLQQFKVSNNTSSSQKLKDLPITTDISIRVVGGTKVILHAR